MNYEPSGRQGLRTAQPVGAPHTPFVSGPVIRQTISRENSYGQAGARYRAFEPWERDDLITTLVDALSQCDRDIQERMVGYFAQSDADYGRRVAEGLGVDLPAAHAAADDAEQADAYTAAGESDDAESRLAGAHGDEPRMMPFTTTTHGRF